MLITKNLINKIILDTKIHTIIDKGSLDLDKVSSIESHINLKNHQKLALEKIQSYEQSEHLHGIYADNSGSGKSFPILEQINNNPILPFNDKIFINNFDKTFKPSLYIKTNIIVCSYYLIYQWINYITQYSNLTFYTISNYKSINYILKNGIPILDKYNIILISCSFYNKFYKAVFKNNINKYIYFSRIIYDDVNNLTIIKPQKINSLFTWFVTSSPENLIFLNHINYILKSNYSIDYFVNNILIHKPNYKIILPFIDITNYKGIKHKGFINSFFNNLYRKRNSFSIDKLLINTHTNISNTFNISTICNKSYHFSLLNTFTFKKLKTIIAEPKHKIIKLLDLYSENNMNSFKNTIFKTLNLNYKNLIQRYLWKKNYNKKTIKISNEIKSLIYKKKITKEKLNNILNEKCIICYGIIKKPFLYSYCCKNLFHLNCIFKNITIAQTYNCPLCTKDLYINKSIVFSDIKNYILTKDQHIINIIVKSKKTLIYSPDTVFLKFIKNNYYKSDMWFLKGNYKTIHNIVTKYKNTFKINILLANNTFSGLNLETTTDLILLSNNADIINTCYRPGRLNTLTIHKLF